VISIPRRVEVRSTNSDLAISHRQLWNLKFPHTNAHVNAYSTSRSIDNGNTELCPTIPENMIHEKRRELNLQPAAPGKERHLSQNHLSLTTSIASKFNWMDFNLKIPRRSFAFARPGVPENAPFASIQFAEICWQACAPEECVE